MAKVKRKHQHMSEEIARRARNDTDSAETMNMDDSTLTDFSCSRTSDQQAFELEAQVFIFMNRLHHY